MAKGGLDRTLFRLSSGPQAKGAAGGGPRCGRADHSLSQSRANRQARDQPLEIIELSLVRATPDGVRSRDSMSQRRDPLERLARPTTSLAWRSWQRPGLG